MYGIAAFFVKNGILRKIRQPVLVQFSKRAHISANLDTNENYRDSG
jgi:hypothetical protein